MFKGSGLGFRASVFIDGSSGIPTKHGGLGFGGLGCWFKLLRGSGDLVRGGYRLKYLNWGSRYNCRCLTYSHAY